MTAVTAQLGNDPAATLLDALDAYVDARVAHARASAECKPTAALAITTARKDLLIVLRHAVPALRAPAAEE